MSGRIPVGSALLMTVAITGLGYGIMSLTTPSEEQFYASLSPDLKRRVDEHKRLRQAQEEANQRLRAIQAQAKEDKPVFAETPQAKK
ncbi:hypothetical protein JCM8547_008171 [Rhodosporidiobolus lusitaniae]